METADPQQPPTSTTTTDHDESTAQTLTSKQSLFVSEWLKDGNATAAARRAGYLGDNADVIGPRMLRKPHIAAAIRDVQRVRDAAASHDLYHFTHTLICIALLDPAELHEPGTNHMLPLEKIPENARKALNLHYKTDPKNPDGKRILTAVSTADRLRAISMLMKTHAPPRPSYAEQRQDNIDADNAAYEAEQARIRAAQREARRLKAEEEAKEDADPNILTAYANPARHLPEDLREQWKANYAKVCQLSGVPLGSIPDGRYRITPKQTQQPTVDAGNATTPPPGSATVPPNQSQPVPTAKIPTNPNQPSSNPEHPNRPSGQDSQPAPTARNPNRPSGQDSIPPISSSHTDRTTIAPAPPAAPGLLEVPPPTERSHTAPSGRSPQPPAAPNQHFSNARNPNRPSSQDSQPPNHGMQALLKALSQTDPKLLQKAAAMNAKKNLSRRS